MLWTKLIDLMMDLIEDPSLVIINCVVLNSRKDEFFSESINNLNSFKIDHNSSSCSTRNIFYSICLNINLDIMELCEER